MRNGLPLGAVTLILAFACFEYGGVTTREWSFCLLAILACALLLWAPEFRFAPPLHPALAAGLVLALAAVALQLVPLPEAWLKTIDPARAELLDGLRGAGLAYNSAPLSVAPSITFAHLERVLAYLLMFFMARELSWRMPDRKWLLTVPVITVATLEAILGLAQYFGGAGRARGTYVNPNHFAGLLHVAFPLALIAAARFMRRPPRVLYACLLMASSAALVLGALYSLSRMGLVTIVFSGAILAALGLRRRPKLMLSLAAAAILIAVFLSIPGGLLDRFTQPNGVTSELRTEFWKESLALWRASPVFGSGLGAWGSAVQKYRHSAPLALVDYAHNDYLQLLAEIGLAGFIPWAFCAVWIFVAPWRASHRLLGVACAASLTAVAIDSVVEFGFYIPANMLAAAWIAGIGSGITWFAGSARSKH